MGKVIKGIVYYGWRVLACIMLVIGGIYLFNITLGNDFDRQCFKDTATIYCNSENMNYYSDGDWSPTIFYCQEKSLNPRVQDFPGIHRFKYLKEETDKCTITKSWVRRAILKE